MYILLAQRRHIFFEKWSFLKIIWELTVYVQLYLFIILYSYWIATNIIQYLLYLVMLVSEYLSVLTHLYLRKWDQLLYQRIMQHFLRNTRTFHGRWGVLPCLGIVRRFRGDDPHFCDCRSDLVLIIGCNQTNWPPLSAEKISLCLSYLVLEICGFCINVFHFVSIFISIFDPIDPLFH